MQTRFEKREVVSGVLVSVGAVFSGIIIGGVQVITPVVIVINKVASSVEIRLRESLLHFSFVEVFGTIDTRRLWQLVNFSYSYAWRKAQLSFQSWRNC